REVASLGAAWSRAKIVIGRDTQRAVGDLGRRGKGIGAAQHHRSAAVFCHLVGADFANYPAERQGRAGVNAETLVISVEYNWNTEGVRDARRPIRGNVVGGNFVRTAEQRDTAAAAGRYRVASPRELNLRHASEVQVVHVRETSRA